MSTANVFLLQLVFLAAVSSAVAGLDVPTTIPFDEGFATLFGPYNLVRSPATDGTEKIQLTLNKYSGSGFVSRNYYQHGFFSASIKLPKDHTAGVVVAFYLSNGDVYEKTHDELDFEFLGNRRGLEWRIQTNVYGNGSTDRGREERYLLPFDPTEDAHRYSLLWTPNLIIFYVDDVPIREVVRSEAMGLDFPSKPMALYATIWDGSTWATDNGRYKVSYKRGPFTADFSDLVLYGCPVPLDPLDRSANSDRRQQEHQLIALAEGCAASEELFELMTANYAVMTPQKRAAMKVFRERQLLYTVCYDLQRYGGLLFPECDVDELQQQNFWDWGESKLVVPRKRHAKRRHSRPSLPTSNSNYQLQTRPAHPAHPAAHQSIII